MSGLRLSTTWPTSSPSSAFARATSWPPGYSSGLAPQPALAAMAKPAWPRG